MSVNIEKIKSAKTKFIGKELEYFDEIDSTQAEAKRNVEKYKNGTVIIADMQTAGRGTHGRVWHTKTDNIAMTIILKPEINISKLEGFTVAIAEKIQQAIKELYGIELEIKLPNDLLLNGKKICGILTEVVTIKEIVKEIFIGIGFNVNEKEFSSDISDIATSLYKETKQVYCREDIICKILENIELELEKRI
jgi:BirA family biotin operon repressor/biotin-[acetyl-CoA-carboxylase] ligase